MTEDGRGEMTQPAHAGSSLHDLVPGLMVADRYQLEEPIGRGAMGVVIAARDTALNQRVALKFLHVEDRSREFRTRFAREARVCAKLRNEHVVRVIDFGTFRDTVVYMAMECLEGEDVAAHLRDRERLEIAVAVDYVVQACEGLAEVHAQGVVHRDLKPSNLFLTTRRDGTPLIKILDFGISKIASNAGLEAELTETGALLGTPRFMSPEQLFGGRHVDARADVWSLGAILYQLLTGKPPFDASSLPNLCARLATDEPPLPPSTLRPELPKALDEVILQCLVRDVDRRCPDVAELAGDLLAAIGAPDGGVRARLRATLPQREAVVRAPVIAKHRPLWPIAAVLALVAIASFALLRRPVETVAVPAAVPSVEPVAIATATIAPPPAPSASSVATKVPAAWVAAKPKVVAAPTASEAAASEAPPAPKPVPTPGMLEERQ